MSRLNQAIDRLGSKTTVAFDAEKQKRQEIWSRIKTDAPEIADFLTEINQEFGKPVRTAVWIAEERVL